MKISIITINRNHKEGLKKTINSVIAQTYKDFEWIVIDGVSTDGSKVLIEKFSDYINYWISEPDKGIFDAMNKGIQVASGEYLLFLNSGDSLSDKHVLHNVIPLLSGKDFYVGREQRNDHNYIWDRDLSKTKDIFENVISFFIPHQSTFIHRSIFDTYGLYRTDLQYSSDWYLFYKALILGNATISRIPILISIFEGGGISYREKEKVRKEQEHLMNELPRVVFLYDFFCSNYDIIKAIKRTKWSCFIFRIYFFIYRNWLKKTDNI